MAILKGIILPRRQIPLTGRLEFLHVEPFDPTYEDFPWGKSKLPFPARFANRQICRAPSITALHRKIVQEPKSSPPIEMGHFRNRSLPDRVTPWGISAEHRSLGTPWHSENGQASQQHPMPAT